MQLTVIVPTFNEGPNIAELVQRITAVADGHNIQVLFVDDSSDETPVEIARVAAAATIPVRLIHRGSARGGLSGAVRDGLAAADTDVCVVMDGDLQHPPEDIPQLVERFERGDVDVVVASRYNGGDASGLAGSTRVFVSRATNTMTRAMFPIRLAGCTDPMTGFFLVDRTKVDVGGLRPQGFKVLLEILARNDLRTAEIPFRFEQRRHGSSKVSLRQGMTFLLHLARLRFGKMSAFAVIGGLGAVMNLLIMWLLISVGVSYIWAAIVAAEVTIVGNFLLQERFVFADMRDQASKLWVRLVTSLTFNNAEAAIRIPVLAFMVETWRLSSVLAAAITLVVAFVARFLFHSLVVYAPRRSGSPSRTRAFVDAIDAEMMRPGEL